jgi:hypothetical protein
VGCQVKHILYVYLPVCVMCEARVLLRVCAYVCVFAAVLMCECACVYVCMSHGGSCAFNLYNAWSTVPSLLVYLN